MPFQVQEFSWHLLLSCPQTIKSSGWSLFLSKKVKKWVKVVESG